MYLAWGDSCNNCPDCRVISLMAWQPGMVMASTSEAFSSSSQASSIACAAISQARAARSVLCTHKLEFRACWKLQGIPSQTCMGMPTCLYSRHGEEM